MNTFKLIYLNEITLVTVNHLYLKQGRLSNLSNKNEKCTEFGRSMRCADSNEKRKLLLGDCENAGVLKMPH